jgi:hypothetical protein
MTLIQTALAGVIVPAVVSTGALCLSRQGIRAGASGTALGIGVGYALGHWIVFGVPAFPPGDVSHWPFWLALGAAILGVIEATTRSPAWLRWVIRAVVCAAALALICRPKIENSWTASESAIRVAALVFAALVSWWNLSALADRLPAPATSASIFAVLGAMAVIFVQAHSAVQGQLALALGATFLPIVVVSWWHPLCDRARGAVSVLGLLIPSFLTINYFFSDLSAPCALLLAFAPAAAWVGRIKPMRRLSPSPIAKVAGDELDAQEQESARKYRPRLVGVLTLIPVLIPLAIAEVLAYLAAAALEAEMMGM